MADITNRNKCSNTIPLSSHLVRKCWLNSTDESNLGTQTLTKRQYNRSVHIAYADNNTQKVYLPSGTYILNKSFTIRSVIKLKGNAKTSKIFKKCNW